MKRKILALALLVCMSISIFAGCAETDPYNYDMTPIVSLEKDGAKVYQNVKIPKKDVEDTLAEAIQEILDANAIKHEQNKDDPTQSTAVEDKDVVNIDYLGKATGKKVDSYSFDPANSKEFPSDLKDKLVGLTIGSGSKDAPVIAAYETTLPEGLVNSDKSASDFAGKTVTLVVYKIHSVTRKVPATETEKETTETITEGTVASGDVVKIDFSYTFKDAVPFSGGSTYTGGDNKDEATGYDLTIGSNSFVDDFEDELIGHRLGETVTVNVTFPATYSNNPFLENMIVDFETVINYLSRSPKELTDDMVKRYTEEQRENNGSGKVYETAEAYKTEMRKAIVESEVLEAVLAEAVILSWKNVPELEETYEAYWDTIEESYKYFYQMGYVSGTYNEYLVSSWPAYYLFGMNTKFSTPEQLASYVLSVSKEDVKSQLVLHAIAQFENISLSEEEYTAGVTRLFDEYKNDEMDTEKKFVKEYGEDNLRRTLLLEKVYDYLCEQAVETEETTGGDTSSDSAND